MKNKILSRLSKRNDINLEGLFKVGDRVECNNLGKEQFENHGERGSKVLKVKRHDCDDYNPPIFYITDGKGGHMGTWHCYLKKVGAVKSA